MDLEKIDSSEYSEEWINIAFDLAYEYDYELQTEKARELYKICEYLSKRKKLEKLYQASIIWQARLYFYEGQQHSSLALLNNILKEIDEEDLETRAWALRFVGSNNVYLGNYAAAYEAQIECLNIFISLKDTAGVIRVKYNLGNNFFSQKNYDLALKNFKEALELSTKIGLSTGEMKNYAAIGDFYGELDSLDLALEYYNKSLEIAYEYEEYVDIGWMLVSISGILSNQGKLKESEIKIKEALDMATYTEDEPLLGFALEQKGIIDAQSGRFEEAIKAMNQSLEIAIRTDSKTDLESIYNAFAEVYYEKGDIKNYKLYINKYIDLRDELQSEQLVTNLTNLKSSFTIQEIEKEKEIELLKKDQEYKDIRSYFITGISIAAGIILFLLLWLAYQKNKNTREKNELLEQKNAEITNRNKVLALTNQDLEKYAYIISHDLREPLRNISGFTTLIRRKLKRLEIEDDNLEEYMSFVINNTNQMSDLLIGLLNYSKVTMENSEEEIIDSQQVLIDVMNTSKQNIEEHKVEIIVQNLPAVYFNKFQLSEVFDSLIDNAIKFKQANKTPIININCIDRLNEYEFRVKDNGIGIEKEYHKKVFEIFQRLHTRNTYKGSGVGLAMTKKVIENRGGRIWMKSKIDEGTTIYFTIPKVA